MLTGPNGQTRSADAVVLAVMVGRIATGDIKDKIKLFGRAGVSPAGGDARSAKLAPDVRAKIASDAAKLRWAVKEGV